MCDARITVKQSGSYPVVTHHPAWVWRCETCGWLGVGLPNENAALKEGSDHAWADHQLALCGSIDGERQRGHPGHRWKHVKGSDSIDKCERCEETCGK